MKVAVAELFKKCSSFPAVRIDLNFRSLKTFLLILSCIEFYSHHLVSGLTYTNEFAVRISGGDEAAQQLAVLHDFVNHGQIGNLKGYYLFEHHNVHKRSLEGSLEYHKLLKDDPKVLWVEQQHVKHRVKRNSLEGKEFSNLEYPDPLYSEQWFLHGGGYGGFDMNVLPAWKEGYTGKGVVVSILDDGIQTNHPDLIQNYDKKASWDINGQDDDPMPQDNGDNKHGTRCAGEVAATAFNEFCGVGIAYNASIGGVRMLDGTVTDVTEATALSHNPDHIHIYSASWGPEDDGKTVDGPGPLAKLAFADGIRQGRAGLGSIFVWASGNGGRYGDSCNCDGYTNSIYTLSISSATQGGTMPWYLEQCSSTLATTYSSGTVSTDKSIATVDMDTTYFKDLKRNRTPNPSSLCTKSHTGTSASAPIAAAICALALEANPSLTWRDMQYLVLMTSRPKPLTKEDGWVKNGVGRLISSKFGYGLMDAAAMVKLAKQWNTVPLQRTCETLPDNSERIIPASQGGRLEVSMNISCCQNTNDAISFLEHVQVKITLHYKPRGNLRIILISPAGTPSTVLLPRPHDVQEGSFNEWPFMSVHFWGEKPAGIWKLVIINDGENESLQSGKFLRWSLVFYGTQNDPVSLKQTKRTEYRSPELNNNHHYTSSDRQFHQLNEKECFLRRKFLVTESDYENGDPKDYICYPCDNSCLSCYGPSYDNCLSCREKSFLSKNICMKSCPDGFYADIGKQECLPCSTVCSTCQYRRDLCISCKANMFLYQQTCIPTCSKGTFADKSVCKDCHLSCTICYGPGEFECLECSKGSFFFNGTCVSNCPKGFHANDHYKCVRCHRSCEKCSSRISCDTCQSNWKPVSSGFCALDSKCEKGWHNRNSDFCEACSKHCVQCTGPDLKDCVDCEKGFYWSENFCVKTCPNGSYTDGDECASCSEKCESCHEDGDKICSICHNGFLLHEGKCVVSCPLGFYAGQGHCRKCDPTCLQCKNETSFDCTSCTPNFYLLNNTCHTSCPNGFFAFVSADSFECAPCYHLCKTCTDFGPVKCTSCYSNSTFVNGTCTPCLDDEYFDKVSQKCQRCHDKCGRCDGSSEYNCLSCQAPLRLDKTNHFCLPCCKSELLKGSKCCTCSEDLDICVNSADHPRSVYAINYDPDDSDEIVIPIKHVVPIVIAICASAVLLFVLLFAILQANSMGWCRFSFQGKQYERVPNHLGARFDTEMEKAPLTQDDPEEDEDIYEKA